MAGRFFKDKRGPVTVNDRWACPYDDCNGVIHFMGSIGKGRQVTCPVCERSVVLHIWANKLVALTGKEERERSSSQASS